MEDTQEPLNSKDVAPEEETQKKKKKEFPVIFLYMLIFLMVLTGTCNSVLNKCLQKLRGEGELFEMHHFM